MAEAFNPRDVLKASQPDQPEAPKRQLDQRTAQLFGWVWLMAAGVAATIAMLGLGSTYLETWTLANTDPAQMRGALARDWSQSMSPDELEAAAELSLAMPVPDEATAYVAARRAVELDPSRAFAWATLTYVETRHAGAVNQSALDALTRSMDACPLCDTQLIRWRFNFVLANWSSMPEALRRRAFEQADLLRWIGPHEEFLAEMRVKARLAGIPFDAYRAAVDTPVKTWDISGDVSGDAAPAARLRGAQEPQG